MSGARAARPATREGPSRTLATSEGGARVAGLPVAAVGGWGSLSSSAPRLLNLPSSCLGRARLEALTFEGKQA